MPIDLREILVPARTAVLVVECQQGLLGEDSPLAELAQAVRAGGMLETLAGLLASARDAGIRVYYCCVGNRPDGVGAVANTPLSARVERQGVVFLAAGSPETAVVPELSPQPSDVVLVRDHGLTAFHETGLDGVLRRAAVETLVVTGVSINIAITGVAIEAVNRGYRVVIPSDCVAGVPAGFARDALRYALRNLAYLTDAAAIRSVLASEGEQRA